MMNVCRSSINLGGQDDHQKNQDSIHQSRPSREASKQAYNTGYLMMGDSGSHYTETYSQEHVSKPPSTGESVTSTDKGLGTTASMTEEFEEIATQPGSPTRQKKREEKLIAK